MSAQRYDSVDAAYIFAGLLALLPGREGFAGGGQLEDYGALWDTSREAAEAVEALIEPDEYDRLGVFCYECLDTDSTLFSRLFDRGDRSIVDTVADWCAASGIAVRPLCAAARDAYVSYELSPVVLFGDYVMPYETTALAEEALRTLQKRATARGGESICWSLYGRGEGRIAHEHIGDFKDEAAILSIYSRITGRRMPDATGERRRLPA